MSEKNYVINVKTKAGTIFTVRGDTAEELTSNIKSVLNAQIPDFIGGLEEALTGVAPAPVAAPTAVDALTAIGGTVVSEQARPAFSPIPPPVAVATAPSAGKQCVHGEMIRRTGNGAKGEWRGFFCPTPKGTPDQCSPAFAQRNTPEWSSF